MAVTKLAGSAANLKIGNVVIPVSSIKPSWKSNPQDCTDSSNFDPSTGRISRDMLPGRMELDIAVDFNFTIENTQTDILDNLVAGTTVDLVVLAQQAYGTASAIPLCSGKFIVQDASLDITIGDASTINGSATFINRGPWATSSAS